MLSGDPHVASPDPVVRNTGTAAPTYQHYSCSDRGAVRQYGYPGKLLLAVEIADM